MKQKSDNEIIWLQLSDLHIFKTTDWNLMKEGYKKLSEHIHPDFIVITGDYRHKLYDENIDYETTLNFLEMLVDIFGINKTDVFLVPGNHDIDDYNYRKESIKAIIDEKNNPEKYLEYLDKTPSLRDAFVSYNTFVKRFYGTDVLDERVSTPDDVICLTWRNKLNIIILNTALISDGNRNHDEIFDINKLSSAIESINTKLPTIVLGHHDFDSICESQRNRLIRIFETLNVKAYLCGDTHKENIKHIDKYDIITERVPCIICGKSAVQINDDYSDVGVIQYSWKEDGYVYVKPYKWGDEKYSFRISDRFICNIDEDYRFLMSESLLGYIPLIDANALISASPSNTYSDITEAHKDIANDIRTGGIFKFYGLRGATFIGVSEVNVIVKEIKNNPDVQIKFLISYPFSEEIRHRLKNMPEFSSVDKLEAKWIDTYKKVKDLREEYRSYKNVSIRFHDTPLIFRLLFTKSHLYLGYYEPNKNSVNSAIYQFDVNTPTYQTYNAFFDYQWKKARHSIPMSLPPKYSFLEEVFSVQPSLVINTTSACNMRCIYCPTGGENLCKISQDQCLPEDTLKKLIITFKKVIEEKGEPILRITGGEPLVDEENRIKITNILGAAKDYKKIVFCTNGIFFKEAYNCNPKRWDAVKPILLLKISLDTLKPDRFCEITGTEGEGKELFNCLIENIKFASRKGFKIELNLVATKVNLRQAEDIIEIFEFARELGLVGVKVLTVNDFGGNVSIEQTQNEKEYISKIIGDVIQKMEEMEYEEREVYLNDNKGIQMRKFIANSDKDEKCTLTIVDHNNSSDSITPRRTFSDFCKSCKYFFTSEEVCQGINPPCATGIMSLTLRADGILSPCRLCNENGKNIRSIKQLESTVRDILKAFDNCFHMNM